MYPDIKVIFPGYPPKPVPLWAETDDEILKKETEEVVAAWYDSSAFLHSLVAHEGMDELEKSITSLPLLIEHSDREEFRNECIRAVNQINNLIDSERLNIGNVLVISQDPKWEL